MNLRPAALGAALALATFAAASAQTDPLEATLNRLVGTWACTQTTKAGQIVTSLTFAKFGDNWVRGSQRFVPIGSKPHTENVILGYDDTKKRWFEFDVDTNGRYGVYSSNAAPNASVLSFSDAYPVDRDDGTTIMTISRNLVTGVSHYDVQKKPVEDHFSCRRQSQTIIDTVTVGPDASPDPSASPSAETPGPGPTP